MLLCVWKDHKSAKSSSLIVLIYYALNTTIIVLHKPIWNLRFNYFPQKVRVCAGKNKNKNQ